jgi:FeS assembly SUF system protein
MMIPMQNFHPKSVAEAGQAANLSDCQTLEEQVIAALRTVYDPEIPLNIYDLGLIYEIDADDELGTVDIKMTLTAPNCPVAGSMPAAVARAVESLDNVTSADVELVWDPPWTKDNMSDEAKLQLGLL